MPDVVGKKAVERTSPSKPRCGIKVEDHIYNSLPVTSGETKPGAGFARKTGQYAHVMLSLGPQKATIPSLVEHSLRAARIELLRSGMQLAKFPALTFR